jgi:hypothetical protein
VTARALGPHPSILVEGISMKRFLSVALTTLVGLTTGAAAAASITFYQDDNYRGPHVTADRAMGNFSGTGFNDGARSAVVHDGRWEICVDAEYRGSCSVLAPGAYPDLGAYAGRISSVRPIDGNYSGRNEDRGRGPVARATLYESANLSGRSYQMRDTVRDMRDMRGTGINDRASSLRVESGYWIFCSDADFRGECRTFGPGDYASLPGMNDRISSGRMISSDYPYTSKPDWQRGDWSHPSQYRQGSAN